jgi:hypothetical protein
MTLKQRNAHILKLLEEQTRRNTRSRKAAREALIEEGIYTQKGKIRKEYGGEPRKPAAA